MEARLDVADLGPFAPDQGATSRVAALGALLGAAAAAVAVGALASDLVGKGFASRPISMPLGALAVACSLAGLYQVSVVGRSGRPLALAGLALGFGAVIASFIHGAVHDGSLELTEFGYAYFNRDVLGAIWRDLLHAAGNTLKLAVLAETFGIVVGLIVATFAISKRAWFRIPAIAYVDIVRGLPLLMLLLLIHFGLTYIGITFPVFTSAVLGLTINSSAYVAEIFRAGIQSIERGQLDAARSLGMPHATAMLFVVIPQAVRRVIPPLTNEFIALVKDTSLVIVLGATISERELMTTARQLVNSTGIPTPFMAASIFYLAITLPLTRLVTILERRLRSGVSGADDPRLDPRAAVGHGV